MARASRKKAKVEAVARASDKDVIMLREVVGKLVELLTGRGLTVTQRGTQAFVQTDPKTLKPVRVNIPHIPDQASQDLLLAIQGFVDHEVGHVLDTDWSIALSIAGDQKLKTMWNIVEDPFVERRQQERFPGTKANLAKLHKFFLERITKAALAKPDVKGNEEREFRILIVPIVRAWSGQEVFDKFLTEGGYWEHPFVKKFVDAVPAEIKERLKNVRSSSDAAEIAAVLNEVLTPPPPPPREEEKDDTPEPPRGDTGSSSEKADDPDGEGANTDKPEDEDDKGSGGEDADDEPTASDDEGEDGDDSDKADGEEDADGEEKDGDGEEKDGDEDADEDADEDDDAEDDEDDDAEDGDESDDAEAGGDPEEDEDGAGGEEEVTPEEDDEVGASDGSDIDEESKEAESGGGKTQSPFDSPIEVEEGDTFDGALSDSIGEEAVEAMRAADYMIYSRDFDRVEKLEVPDRHYDPAWLTGLEDKTLHMVGPMQKEIERLIAARSLKQRVPGFRSGRLHGAGLFKLSTGDDRIFRRVQQTRTKETAVTLLIDNSGSMSGGGRRGSGSSKMDIAMAAAFALSVTLERLKVPHEVVGFTTDMAYEPFLKAQGELREEIGRIGKHFSRTEPIYMPIYKGWDERVTPTVKKRFAAAPHIVRMQNNVDGESIMIATDRLLRRNEARRVMIVLSDGQPAFGTPYPRLPEKHCKMAVERAEALGVETVGIGILDDSVTHFYPKHVVLNDLEELPKTVMSELKGILLRP